MSSNGEESSAPNTSCAPAARRTPSRARTILATSHPPSGNSRFASRKNSDGKIHPVRITDGILDLDSILFTEIRQLIPNIGHQAEHGHAFLRTPKNGFAAQSLQERVGKNTVAEFHDFAGVLIAR